jgi:hypothetical protein
MHKHAGEERLSLRTHCSALLHPYINPSLHPLVCPSVCLSVCPSIRSSVCSSVRLSICSSPRLPIAPSARPLGPSIRPSVRPFVACTCAQWFRSTARHVTLFVSCNLPNSHGCAIAQSRESSLVKTLKHAATTCTIELAEALAMAVCTYLELQLLVLASIDFVADQLAYVGSHALGPA